MKKICIVSTAPTYPANAGHRARIKGLVDEYFAIGLEVHFLFIETYELPTISEEQKYFKGNFHIIERQRFLPIYSLPIKLINKAYSIFNHLFKKPQNQFVDACYPFRYHKNLKKKIKEISPDYIQVEYIFLSYILKSFPNKTKIIDTHDIFFDRNKKIINANWYSTTKSQEIMALERANFVLAITEEDSHTFKNYGIKSTILTVGHLLNIEEIKPSTNILNPEKIKIGFIGSINPINIETCDRLIEELKFFPSIELIIAGKISEYYKDKHEKISFMANPSLDEFYSSIDILYNPTYVSTGLKIKNVEALAYNKILITTEDGAQGLKNGINDAFLCITSNKDLKNTLAKISENKLTPRYFIEEMINKWRITIKNIFNS